MSRRLGNEQAYVLGLLIGGGTIANGTFTIVMPFDKWGADRATAASISKDLLTKVRGLFSTAYKIDINYALGNKGDWILSPLGNPSIEAIQADLGHLGLPSSGTLLSTADLIEAKMQLRGMRGEHFLSGIFDARASLTKSHRRFTDDSPVVSVEIPGSTMNFKFVVQLCSWLTDLGSVTDQILFNHPCQHSASDPTYAGWKKGFKIRFLAKSFLASHSFAMKAKASDATSLASKQRHEEQSPCEQRSIASNTVSIHKDIKNTRLPAEVRGKLFLHYHHICAAMGCPHAPASRVLDLVQDAYSHVSVHPRLSKGTYAEMQSVLKTISSADFPDGLISERTSSCENIINSYLSDYPDLKVALAYLLSDQLNGKRHAGSMEPILASKKNTVLSISSIEGVDRAPTFIGNVKNNRGVIISCPIGEANSAALPSRIEISGIDIRVR